MAPKPLAPTTRLLQLIIGVSAETRELLQHLAIARSTSVSALVRQAIAEFLLKQGFQA